MDGFIVKKVLLIAVIFFLAGVVGSVGIAADDVYKRGQDQTITVNCDNPVSRVDGTPLDVSEIDRVVYYIDVSNGFTGNPLMEITMLGGCMASTVDLQALPVNVEMGRYAKAIDTNGLSSVVAAGRTFVVQSANPNAPGQIR